MKTLPFQLLLLLIFPAALFAQNAKIDSLRRVIETAKVDTLKGRALCALCGELLKAEQYSQAKSVCDEGLQACREGGNQRLTANCLNNAGIIYLHLSEYAEALSRFSQSLSIRRRLGDSSACAASLNNIGLIHASMGRHAEALRYYEQSFEIKKKIGDRKGMADRLDNIGSACYQLGDYEKALKSHQRGREILESLGDSKGVASCLDNMGLIYEAQGKYPEALKSYQASLALRERIGFREGVSNSLNNMGLFYFNQEELVKALDCYQRSLTISEELGDKAGSAYTLNNIGILYRKQGLIDKAMQCYREGASIMEGIGDMAGSSAFLSNMGAVFADQGQHQRALEHFLRCLKIEEEIGDRSGVAATCANIANAYCKMAQYAKSKTYAQNGLALAQAVGHLRHKQSGAEALYRADSALGDWKGAFEAHRLHKIYSDSLKNDDQSKELGRLESKAEYEKQAELDRVKAEEEKLRQRERFTWMLGSAGGGLAFLLVIAFTLFRGRQKERRANSELLALNEEIRQKKTEIEAINAELQASLEAESEQRRFLALSNGQLAERNQELKEAQEQLVLEQSSREQAQRMAGIGEISAIVAHEVNTPLGAIKGGAQNLIDRLRQNAASPELQPLLLRAIQAQPLSSREERAALRNLEPACEEAGFDRPEEAARQLVACGLHDLDDPSALSQLAQNPQSLSQLVQTGSFLAQASNIQRAAERAASIITALKTYANLAAAQKQDETPRASVAETLGLVLKLYDYYLGQGVALSIDPIDELPPVSIDAGALAQVWTKLLLNSIYGMNRKGKLEIRFQVTQGFLLVEWQDDGPAPAAETLTRAFEPGAALRDTEPPIDLSLCRAFLEGEAGGGIAAHCPEGGGLAFSIRLPLCVDSARAD